MMVKSMHMRELIELLHQEESCWWKFILEKLELDSPFQFSEYETYASYCLGMHGDQYISIRRPWFRYGKSYFNSELNIANINKLSWIYDFVAFEKWDTPSVTRRIRAHIIVLSNFLIKVYDEVVKNLKFKI
jgi:hypothetical protein